MKILLSAYSCGATRTSEPGVAWRAIHHALGEGHEVWAIIQRSFYEKDLRAHLDQHPLPGFHPVFMDLSPLMVKLFRRGGPAGSIYYPLWQRKLVGFAGQLHQKIGFDLAHHVTFARYWTPCGVRDLGIPFIWGPVGAAESAPASFRRELPARAQLFEFARDGIRKISTLDPALRATARAATIAIGITRETCEAMRKLGARRVVQLPLSLAEDELTEFDRVPPPPAGPFRALCLGRLIHWKGFYLAIRAFAIFSRTNPDAELWIAGSGSFRGELEKEVAQTGLGSRIKFLGQLSHATAMETLARVHVLVHPALHEAFGNVCQEAMAAGRPVVCLDIGGPASQVTAKTGRAVPATDPAESVEKIAEFLTTVANDRALLAQMSDNARARVHEEFTTRRTGPAMSALYAEAVASYAESRRTNNSV
jgi:glycosyltransferase involved in cell wall biosynthesis